MISAFLLCIFLLGRTQEQDLGSPEELAAKNAKLKAVQKELVRLLSFVTEDEPSNVASLHKDVDMVKPKKQPHILFFLADDFGWGNVGYHNHDNMEVDTPTINKLVKQGVELDRFYSFNQCGPSRSSLLSGRNSQYVNYKNSGAMAWNPENPVSGYGGIPPNMTLMGAKMKQAGYKTGYTGKWDVGFASLGQMPYNNGFDKFFGYLLHANSYCSEKTPVQAVGGVDICQSRFFDLWEMDKEGHRPSKLAGSGYEEEFFLQHSLGIIEEHDPKESPLFLFHASHLVHSPLQIPEVWLKNFTDITDVKGTSDHFRRQYAAMVQYMDAQIETLVQALKAKDMWEDTVFIFMSDNGGPVYASAAANNYPLRGSKLADFEGGIRVNAFVSGGFLPESVRNTKTEELGHVSDWYTTLCGLAGVSPFDELGHQYDLPEVDGIDLWPMITGTGSGRDEIFVSDKGIIMGKYKLLTGKHGFDIRTGPLYPNNTCVGEEDNYADCRQPGGNSGYWMHCEDDEAEDGVCMKSARGIESFCKFEGYPQELSHLGGWVHDCEVDGKRTKLGCLFNIFDDPYEERDLSLETGYQEKINEMYQKLQKYREKNFNPDRGSENYLACIAGFYYGGFIGPFLDEHGQPLWDANSDNQASPPCDACEQKAVWPHEEYCVSYPDVNRGFKCTPYVNGKCTDSTMEKPRVKGNNPPTEAKFLCGHKTKSWAENIESEAEFYFAETPAQDLQVQQFWTLGNPSNEFPFPDVCPVLDIEPAAVPIQIRRN